MGEKKTVFSNFRSFLTPLTAQFNSRLSRKIVLWVFIAIVAIEGIILVPSVQRREQELLSQLKEVSSGKVTWILITHSPISGKDLVTYLRELQQSQSLILGGAVYQSSGQLIETFGEPPQLSLTQINNNSPRRNGSFYDDVVWSGTEMKTKYTIVIRHDASSVSGELIAYIIRIGGLVVIISLFLTITVWIALKPIVIAPIFCLRRDLLVAGETVYHDRNPPEFYSASIQRKDELGDVIAAFKRMFAQITEAIEARKQAEAALKDSLDREAAYSQALDRELEKGRLMQKNFLPTQILQKPGWEIAAFTSPARRVAGDFYDVFELPGNNVGLVIADVCDKGVSAALFMGLFRSLIRIFSGQTYLEEAKYLSHEISSIEEKNEINPIHFNSLKAVKLTNSYIAQNHGDTGMFATLFFGVLDIESGTLTYINGGHEPLSIVDANGNIKKSLKATGTVIGIIPDSEFKIQQTVLDSGDILLGYTDGIVEARGNNRNFFTRERLLKIIAQPFISARAILEEIKLEVLAHIGEAEQSDDMTILTVKRLFGK
ncbi:MAG: PP2C family protein-serine/threonine phosphatase [Pleurocapsa sp. MO_226.B13]|nr:PP2C family protein-serine/threonine phosphatase [Pleurocapsa sp. MO_226.B13]